jgi:hypothetical protein
MQSEMNTFFYELQKYELNDENIQNIQNIQNILKTKIETKSETILETKIEVKPEVKNEVFNKTKSNIFIPKERDSLFWCFYLIKNGHLKYELIDNKNIITEKQFKINWVEELRKHKPIIKQYKFTTLSNIENNLANEDKININTFLTLCVVENKNVLIVKKNTYYELLMNDSEEIFIIYFLNNGKFGYEQNLNKVNDVRTTFYKLDNFDKPIKSITYYKVNDLIDICNKLSIEIINKETNKSKSKKDLYEDIIKTF